MEGSTSLPDVAKDLCGRCAEIDFDKAFSMEVESYDGRAYDGTAYYGRAVLDLHMNADELRASSCPLCRLFGAVATGNRDPGNPDNNKGNCSLRAFSARQRLLGLKEDRLVSGDPILLGVFVLGQPESVNTTGFLGQIPSPAGHIRPRLVHRRKFDAKFVQMCLNYCLINHQRYCQRNLFEPEIQTQFRVIDCKTRNVITAPLDCEYAALSYVWGQPSASKFDAGSDKHDQTIWSVPDGCSEVINDSMKVVLEMNLQYLWVDKYCIDQLDALDKHNQISRMDVIYASARFTIIAATKVPDCGLPGIDRTWRRQQPCLKIRDRIIAHTLSHPSTLLKDSKWATR